MKSLINIWMQPVYARLNMDSRRSLYVLLALFPIAGQLVAGAMFYSKGAEANVSVFLYAFLLSMAACVVLVLFAWMVTLVMNFGLQYSPANAALVPGLKRNLQLALAIPMVLTAAVSVVATFLITQKFTLFPAFICILVFSYFIGVMRLPWLVFPAVLMSQLPVILRRNKLLDDGKSDLLGHGAGFELVMLGASVLMLVGVLRWFFSLSDEGHFKLYKRTQTMRDGINSREIPINKFAASFHSPFIIWMQTCIRQSQTKLKQADTSRLAGFALGPRLHWMTIITQLFLMVLVGVLMVVLMESISQKSDQDFILGVSIGFPAAALIGMPIYFCVFCFFTLFQTRTEQALFSLTPAVKMQANLDRALTRYLLRQFFVLLGISALSGYPLIQFGKDVRLAGELLTLALSCLFIFVLAMTHQYGSMKAANDHPLMKLGLIAAILLVMGVVMTIWISSSIAWWLSAAIVIVTSITLIFRLKRNAQTVQFPVGRAVS